MTRLVSAVPFLFSFFSLAFSLVSLPSRAAQVSNDPRATVQLVQSAPAETGLEEPGLPNTLQVWTSLIHEAQSSIDMAHYYISSKAPKALESQSQGIEALIREIETAVQHKPKLQIRILVSVASQREDSEVLTRLARMKNVQVRTFDLSSLTGGVHSPKYWIVDRKKVFIGSQDLDWRHLNHTQELGVKVEDLNLARQLSRIFNQDWSTAETERMPTQDLAPLSIGDPDLIRAELVTSPDALNPGNTRSALTALKELLEKRDIKSVKIQLVELSPVFGSSEEWNSFVGTLEGAATRGVKVQILLAKTSRNLELLSYLKALNLIPRIEVKLVQFPDWSGGKIPHARMIRSKYMVVDDRILWLGNSNWSHDYFARSRNVELILRDPAAASIAKRIFDRVWEYKGAERVDTINSEVKN